MRVVSLLLIGLILVFSAMGCKQTEGDSIERNKKVQVAFKVLEGNNIPDKILKWIEKNKEYEQALLVNDEEKYFAVVARGLQRTGGYAVNIKAMNLHIAQGESTLEIDVEYIDPKPNELVTQAITYPCAVAEVILEDKPAKVEFNIKRANP